MENSKNKLIILDLDETLIHCTPFEFENDYDFKIDKNRCRIRTGLTEFITKIAEHFELAIWSSAPDEYVQEISAIIKPTNIEFKFIWGKSKCSIDEESNDMYSTGYDDTNSIKDLRLVNSEFAYSLDNILIIDDTPQKARLNLKNLICTNKFTGDKSDDELKYLLTYLLNLKDLKNLTDKDHSNWEYEERYS